MQKIFLRIIAVFFVLFPSVAIAELNFSPWFDEQAKEYSQALQKENASLTEQDIERAHQRVKNLLVEKNWAEAAAELTRIVGRHPDKRNSWLSLSTTLQAKNKDKDEWKVLQDSKFAAYQAYRLSKTNDERAEALLAYGNTLNPEDQYETPGYIDIYEHIYHLTDLITLKEKKPELDPLMKFQMLRTRINNQGDNPSACITFTHPLAIKDINYMDYIAINPKIDGILTPKGNELCFSPVQYGATYDILLKEGLPNAYKDKLKQSKNISVKVKDQESRLSFSNNAYILMRDKNNFIPLSATNVDMVKVKILRVNDRGLNKLFGNHYFLNNLYSSAIDQIDEKIGELVYEGEMDFAPSKNKTTTQQIPFSSVIKEQKPGLYVVFAEQKRSIIGLKAHATQWVIISDIGLTTFSTGQGDIWVNARSLKTAKPLKNVEFQLIAHNNSVLGKTKSTEDGMAIFNASLTRGTGGNRPMMILAYGEKDEFSLFDLKQAAFDLSDRGVAGRSVSGPLDAFLYTERGVYRPKEVVHINTLLRDNTTKLLPNIPLIFKVLRPDGIILNTETIVGNALGFYTLALPISESARTGSWTVLAYSDPKKKPIGRVNFSVEDFIPSKILVSLKSNKDYIQLKDPVDIAIQGQYLFGAPAAHLSTSATMTIRTRKIPYPGFDRYSFGLINEPFFNKFSNLLIQPLNNQGEQILPVTLDTVLTTTHPLEAEIDVTIADDGGRPEVGSVVLPLRFFPYMIGIKPNFEGGMVNESDHEACFDIIALTNELQLKAISNLEYQLLEERPFYTWYQTDKSQPWQYKMVPKDIFLSKGEINLQAEKPTAFAVPLKDWGSYRLEIKDPKTGAASSIRFTKGWSGNKNNVNTPDKVKLKVNKTQFEVGDTVELYIESPFDGEALLTVVNHDIIETHNIPVSSKGTIHKLKTKNSWGLGAYCLVSAFRPLSNTAAEKMYLPKRAVGLVWVELNPNKKILNISLKLPAEAKPLQTINIPVQVTSDDGKDLPMVQMTLAAVDEGILKLTDFKSPNPIEFFLGQRLLSLELRDIYGKLIDPIVGAIGTLRSGGGGDSGDNKAILSSNMQALSKKSFKVVSLYSGLVALDKKGRGTVSLNLPEFNGMLRIMAVAFDETRFGSETSNLLIRDPIVVEGTLPKFLAPLDTSVLSLSFHNIEQPSGEYTVTLSGQGPLEIVGSKNLNINLTKSAVENLAIPIKALATGDAKISVQIKGPSFEQTRNFDLTIRNNQPYTTQTKTQLLIKNQSTNIDKDVLNEFIPGTEKIIVSFTATVPWCVTDIVTQLSQYEYDCVEQIVSKGYGFLLGNELSNPNGVNQTLAVLSEKQNSEGAFPWWNNQNTSDKLWLSAYTVDFLIRCQENGFQVPRYTLERGLERLIAFVQNQSFSEEPITGIPYALYVLSKADKIEKGNIRYFFDTYFDQLKNPLDKIMIAVSLVNKNDFDRGQLAFASAFKNPENNVPAPFGTKVRDAAAMVCLMKEALNKAPNLTSLTIHIDTLLGFLGDISLQTLSTQEQAWLLLAANAFTDHSAKNLMEIDINQEKITSNKGLYSKLLDRQAVEKEISIKNMGDNSIFQHLTISGIPKAKPVANANGIEVTRTFYDLKGNKIDITQIAQGTQVVIKLEGKAHTTLPHQLLIVDLLPAGFEIENSVLNQDQVIQKFAWLGESTKTIHVEPRDDKYVSTISLNENRNFKLSYLVRAVSVGTYTYPGLLVEDMYAPTYFARTDEFSVRVVKP